MKLSQRILIPTLALFALILAGLFFYSYLNTQEENRNREIQDSALAQVFFYDVMEDRANLALNLASQTASDPNIQAAFAARDRQKLIDLTVNPYQSLMRYLPIPQYQFILPSSVSFLQVNNVGQFGEDLSKYSDTVKQVNATQKPASGMEVSRGSLHMLGVAPVYYQNQYIGAIEYGFIANNLLLNSLKSDFGGDWRIMLTRQAAQADSPENTANLTQSPIPNLFIVTTTGDVPFANATAYAQALNGETTIAHVHDQQNRDYSITTIALKDFTGNIIGVVDVVANQTAIIQTQNSRLFISILVFIAALALGAFTLTNATQRALNPLDELTRAAGTVASGDLSQQITVKSDNEIGQLAEAFNGMTAQLRDLVDGLKRNAEERTKEAKNLERRTRELEISSIIARDITVERDLNKLLTNAVNQIAERFGLYYAAIFLVDDLKEYAALRAATGDAGHQMIAEGFHVKVGSVDSLVGFVTSSGYSRLILDTEADAAHFQNLRLPNTRSEIALPLLVGENIIGALDIHSSEEAAFDQSDLQIMQTLADQLAIAIENTRLAEQMRTNLEELNFLYQEQTRKTWKGEVEASDTAFEYDGLDVIPTHRELPREILTQLRNGHPVSVKNSQIINGNEPNSIDDHSILLVPLLLHGQVIGTLGLEREDPDYEWSPDEFTMAENIATQTALALETARLLEETQRRAMKEQRIGEITAKIGASINMHNILQTAVEELGRAIPGSEVVIEFQSNNNNHADTR